MTTIDDLPMNLIGRAGDGLRPAFDRMCPERILASAAWGRLGQYALDEAEHTLGLPGSYE